MPERDSVSQSGLTVIAASGGTSSIAAATRTRNMDVERCQRGSGGTGTTETHTVIVGSRQRIQPVRNNATAGNNTTASERSLYSHGHFKRQVGRLYGQTVRRQSDNGVRQLDHGLIVSVRQPVRYRLIRRHKPPECDSITKPSEIHEVERITTGTTTEYRSVDVSSSALMVRRVGLQPERHDCHSGGPMAALHPAIVPIRQVTEENQAM